MKFTVRPIIEAGILTGVAGAFYFFGQWQAVHEAGVDLSSAPAKKSVSHTQAEPKKSSPPADPAATQALVARLMNEPSPFIGPHELYLEQAISILTQLAKIDPQLAVDYLAKQDPSNGTSDLVSYEGIFGPWATADLAQAKTVAELLPPGVAHASALRGLFGSWLATDPQAALDWQASLHPGKPVVLGKAQLKTLAGSPRFDLAAKYVNAIQDEATRNADIVLVAAGVGRNDLVAAMDWLNQVATSDTYKKAAGYVASSLIKGNPADAATVFNRITDPAVLNAAITNVSTSWGATNPQMALTWAATLATTDSDAEAPAMNSIVASWAKNDPAAVAAYVQNSANPSAFFSADPAIAQSLAASDPAAGLTFANSLPSGEVKNQALSNVLVTISQSDFTAAWTDAISLPATENPIGVMTNLASSLATKNPAQAAELIAQFPAGTAQDNAMATVASTWIKLDPQAFSVWLASVPPGDVRDTAIAQLVSSSQATKNPAGVLGWVNTVTDPQTKAALLQMLVPAQAGETP